MWPYAATTANLPSRHDRPGPRRARRARASGMAVAQRLHGAMQASDLYVASGTTADYLYGKYRIFAFTIELSAVDYPKDTVIASETGRNRDAVLWLAERAWCPLSVLGATRPRRPLRRPRRRPRGVPRLEDGPRRHRHGARRPPRWTRGNPAGTTISGVTRPADDDPVRAASALVSGLPAGSRAYSYDLDGRTTVRSPPITLPGRRRPAPDVPLAARPRREREHGRLPAGDRRGRRTGRRRWSGSGAARRRSSRAPGARRRWRWTRGPGRRSGSGSRPPTAARRLDGRGRASTTCGSRARRADATAAVRST